ncbi:TRAP transporter substrate-binding protein DctP [Salipiger bermudensis]|uniref:TRAP transporter substrate-binding protein n=1 Tax=Salipiger bermudensis TaxID=344736 RepID=UPI00300B75CC
MIKTTIKTLALGAVSTMALAAPAAAIDERTFRVTQVFPSTHWHMTEGIQKFTDKVKEATDGAIDFEIYHAGQLGKESTTVVTSGLAEFGLLVPGYEVEKLPLTSVVELPGYYDTSCEGTRQFWELAKPGGAIYEAEYKPLGIRPLYVMTLRPYEVQTNEAVVESVEDMKGLKLRANGAMAKTVAAVGGTPVQVTSNEFYDALARGTVDGGMWISGSTKLVGLENVLNHTVTGTRMGAGSTFFAISERAYQSLDPELQEILTTAGEEMTMHMCEYLQAADENGEKELVAEGKLEVHPLSEEEAARWNEMLIPVAEQWAEEMDRSGRPGTDILEAYRAVAEEIE